MADGAHGRTMVDLFAGAGGFSRGFTAEGFGPVAAVELQATHADAYRANHPEARASTLTMDLRTLADPCAELGVQAGEVDVVIGGPPCEAFTGANARRHRDPLDRLHKDPRGGLVLEYVRVVAALRPRVFVMENVVGVAEGPLRGALQAAFRDAGFPKVWFQALRAEEHGTPSRRHRMFVSNLPLTPRPAGRAPSVAEALAGLDEPGATPDGVPDHDLVPLSPGKQARVARVRPGESLVRYRSASGRGLANWMRLHADQLAPPVMGRSRFLHPTMPRALTVREHARLMGFPDSHRFVGGFDARFDQVGEAVPPPLARALAAEVRGFLEAAG